MGVINYVLSSRPLKINKGDLPNLVRLTSVAELTFVGEGKASQNDIEVAALDSEAE